MKNKKIVIISIVILASIVLITILTYIFFKKGNTINSFKEDNIKDILEIKGYKATLEIEVETNKNKTKYVVKQSVDKDGKSKQEVIEPKNIAGIVTEYDGKDLKIVNNNLKLSKTFEDYSYVVDNSLWLDSFINEYKNVKNTRRYEKNNEIVLEIKNNKEDKYNVYKKLYIDKDTKKPTKMLVQDINQKTRVYILYTKIEIF